jgi:hypothetical protein
MFISSLLPNSCFICLLIVSLLILVFILIPLTCNNIKACHAFHHHVLALEPDMDIFTKALKTLVAIPIPETTHPVVNIDDEDSLMERQPKRILDCE